MLKTLGGKLVNNIGLKLLALFFATVLWVVVVNTDDPTVRKSMTVSVFMKNQEYITDMGKYMDVLNESNTVTFYYTTKRSVWEGISGADFSATADMEKIEAKANGGYRVPVTVSAIRNSNQITIENKQMYLEVALEDLGKQQFQIKANTSGTVAEGCALGTVKIDSTNVVQVSGPTSVVNSIDSVVATINVNEMANDITDNVVPVFYDENGEVIDTTKLDKSVETVRISAQILNTKEVPLELTTMGTPAKGYQLVDVFSDPLVVRVKGVAAVLNTLDKIQIPAAVLDLTGVTSSIKKTIDISTYLEGGVSLVVSADAKVSVTAEIEPIETKEYKVSVSNLTAEGLKSGYQLSYVERYAIVKITAGKGAHNDLNAVELKGTVNVDGLTEGTHSVKVSLNIDPALYTVESAFVEVEIKAVADGGASESTENTESSEKPEESTQAGATGSTEKPGENSTENTSTENEGEGKPSENTGDSRD
ncbi:MAG: hypothetical protein IKU69_06035 [Roseburia sp.]|nr:hypothetical protein [Roseburia sp.]